jgi:hypothetical protein
MVGAGLAPALENHSQFLKSAPMGLAPALVFRRFASESHSPAESLVVARAVSLIPPASRLRTTGDHKHHPS